MRGRDEGRAARRWRLCSEEGTEMEFLSIAQERKGERLISLFFFFFSLFNKDREKLQLIAGHHITCPLKIILEIKNVE